ncbi:long-chain fatty acid--CoA ligase [Magnetospirillum sp. UT-4]|uniref:AMP-dependent synthetase/ligase n=1 Tax=Magnetospirillum sp. UT-4 TaxID=2681467 RepID=UPI0013823065|nr:long-chain fatty acid--CoA ligase [Magnetospirillum sp. UT-4]CAA7613581.1 putative long-chain-fatty-acid--CoA ligase [Magnetospirillum sp. UT-4]
MFVDYSTCQSVPAMFLEQADRLGERPFLWARRDGVWRPWSWAATRDAALALAAGLKNLGLQSGDRVMLVAENRPEWAIADLAAMIAGGVTVPAYTTNTAADHLHVMTDSGARVAIVSTRALAERVLAAAAQAAVPPAVICLEPAVMAQACRVTVLDWAAVTEAGRGRDLEMRASAAAIARTDTACIIYTSGTGGAPKGVMLSHGALIADCLGAHRLLAGFGLGDEVFLSFLPLSHSYEHTVGLIFPIAIAAQIRYAEGLEHLAANMAETHPTIMTAVPRLYETMRGRILHAIERQGGLKARLFRWAVALGAKRYRQGGRLGPLDSLADLALDRLVRSKVRARFGGRLKALVSGGAPLSFEVGLFFTALGVRILQGYGQTEAGPAVSCNPPDRVKIDTVGPPLEGIEVRIAGDGEILVRGEVVMQGYWRDEDATRRAVRPDGWLHTGDIGEIDGDGYIRITDRKKDIIVNSGGDNIAPQRIEGFLTLQPEIAQAMVHGDKRPHLVALIVPAEGSGAAEVAAAVERVNRTLSPIEKIRRFALAPAPFGVDNGMLTPTLKIRRHVIRQKYGEVIEGLYGA